MMLVQFSAGVFKSQSCWGLSWKNFQTFRMEISVSFGNLFQAEKRERRKKERERERERAPAASDNVYKEEEALRTFAS